MLGKAKCKDPYHSTHYRKLLPQTSAGHTEAALFGFTSPTPVRTCNTLAGLVAKKPAGAGAQPANAWLEKVQLLQMLQQAEQLLHGQCDLIDGLQKRLGEGRGDERSLTHQQLGQLSEHSLAAMQQQHTVTMMQAVADYVRHEVQQQSWGGTLLEERLAAVQQHQTVQMIQELTRYLRQDMHHMQQLCNLLALRQGSH